MSLTKHKFFKNFVALVVLTLVMFVLAGCQKDDKIELTLEKDQYQVTVGEEITVHPGVTKGKDVKEVKLVYSSDDESIATYVDGKIKGIAVGETKVKVAVDGRENVYKEFTVKVVAKPTFTIIYNLNGGINSSQNPTTFTEDDLPITLRTPNRVEYEFKGWYLTSNFAGNPVTQITEAEDIVLYAKWEEVKYQITYELDGGTLPEGAITAFAKSELNVTLPTPTKDGFRFDGWYLTNTFEGDAVTTITKAEAITVYAKWTQLYKITYELDGGTLADALVAFAEDQLPITLKTPTKEGFEFAGWFLTEDFSGEAVTQITEAKDITLYAKWEVPVKTSTITYHLNGGTWGFANKEDLAEAFLKDFYSYLKLEGKLTTEDLQVFMHGVDKTSGFDGTWYDHRAHLYAANDKEVDASKPYFINQPEYNAKWIDFLEMIEVFTKIVNETQSFWGSTWTGPIRLRQYLTNSRPNGNETAEDMLMLPEVTKTATTYRSDRELILSKPIREGYKFVGWFEKEDFSGGAVEVIPAGSTENKVFYAKWEEDAPVIEEFNITYVLNEGTLEDPVVKFTEEDLPLTLPTPTKEGFKFLGCS